MLNTLYSISKEYIKERLPSVTGWIGGSTFGVSKICIDTGRIFETLFYSSIVAIVTFIITYMLQKLAKHIEKLLKKKKNEKS
jgi:hypothetical protein